MLLLDVVDHMYRQPNDVVSNAMFWSGCLALVLIMKCIRPHARHSGLASQPAIVLELTHDSDIVEKGLGEVEVVQPAAAEPIQMWRAAAFSWALTVSIANLLLLLSDQFSDDQWSGQLPTMDKLSLAKFIVVHQFINVASVSVWASYLMVTRRRITGRAACPKQLSGNRFCEQNRGMMFIAAFLPLLSAVTPTTFEGRIPVYNFNGVALPIQAFYVIQSIVWAIFAAKSCTWQHQHIAVHAEDIKCWTCRTRSEKWSLFKAKIGRLSGSQQGIRLDDD